MRFFKTIIATCILLSVFTAAAQLSPQQDSLKANSNFAAVEVEAFYPGGTEVWKKYLEKNLNSNTPNKNNAPIGKYTAIVVFIVDKDGSVSNVQEVTHFGYGMEEEVVRVIEHSGKWSPTIQNGKPIKAYRKQPVTFLLTSADFEITTKEPYVLFANVDNEITVTAKRIKPSDISINVQGGKSVSESDGKFIVKVTKPGRVTIEIVNNKKG